MENKKVSPVFEYRNSYKKEERNLNYHLFLILNENYSTDF